MLPAQLAPDGAPGTPISRSMQFGGVKLTATCLVTRKRDDVVCTINESDFDPKLHERVEEEEDKAPVVKGKKKDKTAPDLEVAAPVKNSGFSRGELAAMSIEALHQLPEWERVPNKGALKTKDDFILAIIAARTVQL